MYSANATELFNAMDTAIRSGSSRTVSDPASPQRQEVLEAPPGLTFVLRYPQHNAVAARSIDLRWAVANTLHFFADTEMGFMLPKYNRYAEKFLTDGSWLGAYGAIAMPQVRIAAKLLQRCKDTRRAVVTLGGIEHDDANRPACWNLLHFLSHRGCLDMLVYQRSLNLYGVMPYDCIVLTNILVYVATLAGMEPGNLRWTVGSLHTLAKDAPDGQHRQRNTSIILPTELLSDSQRCLDCLVIPESAPEPWNDILTKESRT